MNKTITIVASVVAGVALPLLGMTITPTRDAILGLAPDQAVLQLADKIDEQRVSTEQTDVKIAELEATIASQQQLIDQQNNEVAEQKASVESVKTESQAVQAKVNNEAECRKLYDETPECKPSNKIYSNKTEFDKFIAGEKSNEASDSDIDRYKRTYETCKTIVAKCD